MVGRRCRGGGHRLWALAFLTTVGLAAAAKKRSSKDEDANKVVMPRHSFQAPLEYSSLLDDWMVSGASLLERDRLLLHPGVPDRAGFAWNMGALLTNNFEITVHFRTSGEKDADKVPADQSFGVFYTQDNISAVYNETNIIKAESWKAGMDEQRLTLSGSKGKFTGFGAVLSMKDADKKPKPSVSFVTNDGTQELEFGKDVPVRGAKVVDFRNTLNAAQLRIRVQPTSIEAFLKQSPSLSWNECFKIDREANPVKAGGFVGITAWSGTTTPGAVSDLVSVIQVDLVNYDDTSIGEEMKDVSAQIQDAYREMLTDEHRHFLDQKSQGEHLARLATMLGEHLNSTKPQDEKLFRELEVLDTRVGAFSDDCKLLTKEAHMLLGHDHKNLQAAHNAGVEVLKDEIVGLRRLLMKDSYGTMQKLEAVSKNMKEVKEASKAQAGSPELIHLLTKQTDTLSQTVSSRGTQMTWMMLCLLFAIIGIGLLMWNRMHYYEKKHFI